MKFLLLDIVISLIVFFSPSYEKVLLSMQDQFTLLNEIVNEREIEYAEQQAVLAQKVNI